MIEEERDWKDSDRRRAIAASLLVVGDGLHARRPRGLDDDALHRAIITADGFGFLVGVLADYAMPAERAWEVPFVLLRRLGTLDPSDLMLRADDVSRACHARPKPHRFPSRLAGWIVTAAARVVRDFQGRAEQIWTDGAPAAELQRRFADFEGIGQKKSAMAVDLLASELGMRVAIPAGSDVAYDIHVRRVFLRTGIATMDSVEAVVGAARELASSRPADLDRPAWFIGRTYCRPEPACERCPLEFACAFAARRRPTQSRQLLLFAG